MRRYHITLGALTTANGVVVSASSHGTIEGKQIALEGDKIFCRSCKSDGYIICVGPRTPETWFGKQVALENDLCVCKCSSPPRLLANQSLRYQEVEGDGKGVGATSIGNNSRADETRGDSYDERVRLTAQRSAVLDGLPYYIETRDGRVFSGRADDHGLLPRIDTDDESEYAVFWGDEALAKNDGQSE